MGRTALRTRAARSGVRPAEVIKDRQAAIEQMNTKLRQKMQQIERGFSDARTDNLRWYYQMGEVVQDIRINPDQYRGRDGTNGLKLLERALSTQARTLRRSATFREAYSQADFERLVGMENTETKFQLHWGHVQYLLTVDNAEQRWRFAGEACARMLAPPELHAFIKRRLGRSGGHGRRHAVPPTVRGQVRQIEQVTATWNTKQAQVWDGEEVNVLGNLMAVSPSDVDEELITHLKATRDGFVEMAENATKNAERFERIIERAEKILNKKKAAEADVTTSGGRQSRAIDLGDGEGTRGRRLRNAG